MPKSKKKRVEQAEEPEIEEIEDTVEEEHLESVSEDLKPQVPFVPRRVQHRKELLDAAKIHRGRVKSKQYHIQKMEKVLLDAERAVVEAHYVRSMHNAYNPGCTSMENCNRVLDTCKLYQKVEKMVLQAKLEHAQATVDLRDAELAMKEALVRDLRDQKGRLDASLALIYDSSISDK